MKRPRRLLPLLLVFLAAAAFVVAAGIGFGPDRGVDSGASSRSLFRFPAASPVATPVGSLTRGGCVGVVVDADPQVGLDEDDDLTDELRPQATALPNVALAPSRLGAAASIGRPAADRASPGSRRGPPPRMPPV